MKRIDISNTTIGYWKVGEAFKKSDGKIYYHCTCICGKKKDVYGTELRKGRSTSCGCRAKTGKGKNHLGERFGSLTVVDKKIIGSRTYWSCKCDCGNTIDLPTNQVGLYSSCGCRKDVGNHIKEAISDHCVDGTYIPGLKRSKKNDNNTSGVTGVSYRKDRGKWRAYIKFQRRDIFLGNYDTKEQAIEARREGEKIYFGKYLNKEIVGDSIWNKN